MSPGLFRPPNRCAGKAVSARRGRQFVCFVDNVSLVAPDFILPKKTKNGVFMVLLH